MMPGLSDTLLCQLSEFVGEHLGLHFPKERWRDLERGVRAASLEYGHRDIELCVQQLLSSTLTQGQIEILASHLTVGETYFFREKRSLEILEEDIVPGLIHARRPAGRLLRIWSAGCATGEEPYSIAILLSKMLPDLKDWNISILATDLNTRSLKRASEGIYGEWSFRGSPQWVKSRYFTATTDKRWAIVPPIKKMVTFAYLNLMEDVYPSLLNSTNAMDIIFCRNVLMYFTAQGMKKVIHDFYRSLVEGGWLIVSPTETSQFLFSEFVTASFSEATLYKKAGRNPESIHPLAYAERNEAAARTQTAELTAAYAESAETPGLQADQASYASARQPSGLDPPAICYARALELYQQGRYEDAERMAVALVSETQNDEPAILLLARLCANQGRLMEALQWCEKAIGADKVNAQAHYLRATILQEQGSLDEAAFALRRTLYADPRFALAHLALGNLAVRQGKLKESRRHFENTLAVLAKYQQQEILPESEGLTAGRLRDLVTLQRDQSIGATRNR